MASKAFLKRLRKKYRLGEFAVKKGGGRKPRNRRRRGKSRARLTAWTL